MKKVALLLIICICVCSGQKNQREQCSTSDLLYQCRNVDMCGKYIDDLEYICELIRGLGVKPTTADATTAKPTTPTQTDALTTAKPVASSSEKPTDGGGNSVIFENVNRMKVPAKITVEPRNITVPPGATAQFNCRSLGAPAPLTTISRLTHDIETPEQERMGSEKVTTVSVIQEIEDVTEQNQGWYRCVAANAFGIDVADAYLTVKDLCEEVACGPGQQCVADYIQESTECVCPECSNDFNITCGTDCKTYYSPCILDKKNCEDQTDVGVLQSGYCPRVIQPEPTITAADELYYVEGERLRLTCIIARDTQPPPAVHWIRVGEDGQYYQVSDSLVLNVPSLTESDTGHYQCVTQQCGARHVSNHVLVTVEQEITEGIDNLEIEKHVCSVFGDPHFLTFDNLPYDYMGVCDYVLAMDCQFAAWLVYGRMDKCSSKRAEGSCLNSVTVFAGSTALELQRGWIINNRGNKMNITEGQTYREGDMTVIFDGRYLILTMDYSGIEVQWDGLVSVHVLVPPGTDTCGMCGNNDNNPDNDLRSRNGAEGSIVAVGNSWAVDRFNRCEKAVTNTNPKCTQTSKKKAAQRCEKAFNAIGLAQCAVLVDPAPFREGCVFDVCAQSWLSERLAPECNAVSTYVQRCAIAGVRIYGWEESADCPALYQTQDIIVSEGCPQDVDRLLRRRTKL